MGLFAKAGTSVQGDSFSEHALQRVNCGKLLVFENRMQTPNHSAIEIAPQLILAVGKQWQACRLSNFDEALMRNAYPIQTNGCR